MNLGMRKLKTILAALLLFVIVPGSLLFAQEQVAEEYEVKALMLKSFTIYINWPKGSRVYDKSRPFVLGVIGDNPFVIKKRGKETGQDWLTVSLGRQKIQNKEVEIRAISDIKEIAEVDFLFVSKSEKKNVDDIVEAARKNNVLTIGDTDGYAKKGILINIYVERGSPKFEVNLMAFLEAGFSADHRMLKLARIINNPRDK